MEPLVLSAEEIQHITHYKRHSSQIKALRDMGIAVMQRPDGSPLVFRRDLNSTTKPSYQPVRLNLRDE